MAGIAIFWSENGAIKSVEKVEGELSQAIKRAVLKSMEDWDVTKSDLMVMRDLYPVSVKLPLTKEQYERYSGYNLRRAGGEATFEVPVYFISYENEWRGESYVDRKVAVVAPIVDDFVEKAIFELAENATKEPEELEEQA